MRWDPRLPRLRSTDRDRDRVCAVNGLLRFCEQFWIPILCTSADLDPRINYDSAEIMNIYSFVHNHCLYVIAVCSWSAQI